MDKHFNFSILKNEVENFSVSTDNSYATTYSEFLKYFENIERIEEHHLTIGSHFVYGWMPTIINFKVQQKEKTLQLFNNAKAGTVLSINELNYMKGCINNSLVGLSKLLHFVNPNLYAIWDSRTYRFVTGKKSQYGISEPKKYLEYLSIINNISEMPEYAELHEQIEKKFNYSLFSTRAIEVVIFEADKKRLKSINN